MLSTVHRERAEGIFNKRLSGERDSQIYNLNFVKENNFNAQILASCTGVHYPSLAGGTQPHPESRRLGLKPGPHHPGIVMTCIFHDHLYASSLSLSFILSCPATIALEDNIAAITIHTCLRYYRNMLALDLTGFAAFKVSL